MAEQLPEESQRSMGRRRSALVLSSLGGETSAQEATYRHGLAVAEIEDLKERFPAGAENALRTKPKDEEALKDEQIEKPKQKGGRAHSRYRYLETGGGGPPFRPADVQRVRDVLPEASERRICRILDVSRPAKSWVHGADDNLPVVDASLASHIEEFIRLQLAFGYRRLRALVRFHDGLLVNREAVCRILKLSGWFCQERHRTPRYCVSGLMSRASRSNERWVMDLPHVCCGTDGWAPIAAVIACQDREIVGYELSLRAQPSKQNALLKRPASALRHFASERRDADGPLDNGLVFQSCRFQVALKDHRLRREFIIPYTPEQNGVIERFFRRLKEEYAGQNLFADFGEARRAIRNWTQWDNEGRPHQSLGYRSPAQYRAQQPELVA